MVSDTEFLLFFVLQFFLLFFYFSFFKYCSTSLRFFTPTQWRSRLGNVFDGTRKGTNRAELKRKAIEIANETFNLQLKFVPNHPSQNEDDIAEAILIGWAYIHPVERKKAFVAKSKE